MYIRDLISKRKLHFGFRQIGSGPAGYYAVAALLKKPNVNFDVTIFDKQPTPFGLVRTGVAPDHPEVKLVQNRFTESSSEPNVHFYGNVEVGRDISVQELKQQFQVVIFAYGCGQSNRLNIDGENANGVYNATDFTNWYNGAPLHFHRLPVELKGDSAVILGNGNVAIDVARILAKSESELKQTDIPTTVLAQLADSKVKNIHIVGRRGPIQASFTTAELRELASVVNVKMDLGSCKDAIESESSQEELKDRLHHRKFQLIQTLQGQKHDEQKKTVHFHFLSAPISFGCDSANNLTHVNFQRMQLTGPARSQKAIAVDETFRIGTNMAVLSLGFKGLPIRGLPFNDKLGILYNRNGRLYDPETDTITHGFYAVGWIRKGPSGIIGSNIPDATETVENILEDIANNRIPASATKRFDPLSLKEKNVNYVDWLGWNQLDKYELDAGYKLGKVREKVQELNRILEIAKH